jgi:thiol peroxidase
LTVIGSKLSPSGIAPDFALDHFDGQAIQGLTLAASGGSIRILNVVNSLDTPIYDIETQRWEQLRSPLAGNVVV